MILASNIPWISKFADFVKLFITKYWIFVCCIVLLMISLNSPVVGYRIIYMGFLLMFMNCFLVRFMIQLILVDIDHLNGSLVDQLIYLLMIKYLIFCTSSCPFDPGENYCIIFGA